MMIDSSKNNIFSVVIVGGGVIGASVAYHLAMRGMSDVVVIEKDSLGGGSTAKAPGGVRQQFGREIEIRLAVQSMKFWEHFEDLTGHKIDFQQIGYLFLLTNKKEVQDFTSRVSLQRKFGVSSQMLTPDEVLEIVPNMVLDGVLAATFCQTDGRLSPADVMAGYVQAARRLGVRFLENVEVFTIRTSKGKVAGVETSDGWFSAEVIVNAAGPSARNIASTVGIDLPVFPYRLHVVVTGPIADIQTRIPCIMEPATTLYMAPEGNSLLLTLSREEIYSKETIVERDFLPTVASAGAARIPAIIDAGLQTAWAGLVEPTPDELPILGKVSEPQGFICANGLSGRGIMFSPAIGKAISEIILDGESSSLDIDKLGIERFSSSK